MLSVIVLNANVLSVSSMVVEISNHQSEVKGFGSSTIATNRDLGQEKGGEKMVNSQKYALPGNFYRWGRASTVYLLELTSLDQLVFILKVLFFLFDKQATLIRRSNVLSLPLQLVFLGQLIQNRCF
jgi:hypothetical protein